MIYLIFALIIIGIGTFVRIIIQHEKESKQLKKSIINTPSRFDKYYDYTVSVEEDTSKESTPESTLSTDDNKTIIDFTPTATQVVFSIKPNFDAFSSHIRIWDDYTVKHYKLETLQNTLTEFYFENVDIEILMNEVESNENTLEALLVVPEQKKLWEELKKSQHEHNYLKPEQIFFALDPLVDLKGIELKLPKFLEQKGIRIPSKIQIDNFALILDGGSRFFKCTDALTGEPFELTFRQYDSYDRSPYHIAGAVYFNDVILPVRGAAERKIVHELKEAVNLNAYDATKDIQFVIGNSYGALTNQQYPKELKTKRFVYEATLFVESDYYVRLAKLLGRI
ncbi:MAG: hypothetical protein EAZ55_12450 [Cytophagales bacterium]|nr:MAG: hypothetical protein EAZ55_12450 [Cytophagales bacterium]